MIIDEEIIPQEEYVVEPDETKSLFLHIIDRAILDFKNLRESKIPIEQEWFQTAQGFLYDKDYKIPWGEYDLSLGDILDYLGVDHDWFYRKLKKRINK